MKTKLITTVIASALAVINLSGGATKPEQSASVTPAEARAIAKEAYIYGFPMVDNYRVEHAYFINTKNPQYKGPWNHIVNVPRVFTPADTAIQTANSDTPYSFLGFDLRAEPIVVTVPAIEKNRYFTLMMVDAYTHNFAYLGTRVTGNDGGSYLIAGPNWKGDAPPGVKKVFRSETELVMSGFRTQLFDPADLEKVKKIQAAYKAEPLSVFLGKPAQTAPPINFIDALTPEQQRTSLQYFNVLNFVLQFCPTHPSEKDLMARFAKIGVGAGRTIDISALSPALRRGLEAGMADAWAEFDELKKTKIDTGQVTMNEMFGTREYQKGNYLYRMAGAVIGIYANSKEEAIYPVLSTDATGQKLDGANRYTLRFGPGQFPPVNAFWSLTMYGLPASLLVANPIDRYLINSTMLPQLKKDADGGLTLYVQNQNPGADQEANWLPAPTGPFILFMRLYWPKEEALSGQWQKPPVTKVN